MSLIKCERYSEFLSANGIKSNLFELRFLSAVGLFSYPIKVSKKNNNCYWDLGNIKLFEILNKYREETISNVKENYLPVFHYESKLNVIIPASCCEKIEIDKSIIKRVSENILEFLLKPLEIYLFSKIAMIVSVIKMQEIWMNRFIALYYFPKTKSERISKILIEQNFGDYNVLEQIEIIKKSFSKLSDNLFEAMKLSEFISLSNSVWKEMNKIKKLSIVWAKETDKDFAYTINEISDMSKDMTQSYFTEEYEYIKKNVSFIKKIVGKIIRAWR